MTEEERSVANGQPVVIPSVRATASTVKLPREPLIRINRHEDCDCGSCLPWTY
jgi:hypothetical protein